ncbi:MAG: tetratricopeptide repeat protein [Myxococcota bacterium]
MKSKPSSAGDDAGPQPAAPSEDTTGQHLDPTKRLGRRAGVEIDDDERTRRLDSDAGEPSVDAEPSEVSEHLGPPDTQQLIAARVQRRLFGKEPPSIRIGRFSVLSRIGCGGMGTVYSAYDEELDRKVAIKVMHDESRGDEARHRFLREAQAMARLSHPNVVTVHEVGQAHEEAYLAMEFIRGESLDLWLRSKPPWPLVLETFIQAGHGLQAAHEAGLVHRDLKPHNIMRSEDGEVKVLDFGLARALDEGHGDDLDSTIDESPVHKMGSMLSSALTRTGTILGTPAYMSPEQFRGEMTLASSDQFSFCVALFEALYGEQPYQGSSLQDRMSAIYRENILPRPRSSKVPATIYRTLVRGLSADPERRWPSMEDLLEPLRRELAPRRRGVATSSLGVALLGVGVAVGVQHYAAQADRCTGAAAQLEGIWDGERRLAVRDAILETDLSYAGDTWRRVERRLDDYTEDWVEAHTEACEATAVRGEQSEQSMDLRIDCLRERRHDLRATIDELTRADAKLAKRAVRSVTGLPRLLRCSNVAALAAEVPPPEDPVVAERVAALDERLSQARAKQRAGRYQEGLAIAEDVVAQAEPLAYEPLSARAWLVQGKLQEATSDYEGALVTLERAHDAALAQRMFDVATGALTQLMFVNGHRLQRHERARRWAKHADPMSRAVRTDEARALYLRTLAGVAYAEGKLDEARELFEKGLAAHEHAFGPEDPETAAVLVNLGKIAYAQGRFDEARELSERSMTINEGLLGPEHPTIASSLDSLGAIAFSQGKFDESRRAHERALEIRRTALGHDHPNVARTLFNLGNTIRLQGDLDRARTLFEQALAIWHKSLGPEHPHIAAALISLAGLLFDLGDVGEAQALTQQALTIWEKSLGPNHPKVALALDGVGTLAKHQGDLLQARQAFSRALALREKALGSEHPEVALTHRNLGGVALRESKLEEARISYERALAIWEGTVGSTHPERMEMLPDLGRTLVELGDADEAVALLERGLGELDPNEAEPVLLAELRFALAGALWEASADQGRDRPRARQLAEHAREGLGGTKGFASNPTVLKRSEVDAWLAEHPLTSRAPSR